jgi:hypothetical protein
MQRQKKKHTSEDFRADIFQWKEREDSNGAIDFDLYELDAAICVAENDEKRYLKIQKNLAKIPQKPEDI